MLNRIENISLSKIAVAAGIGYLIIFITGIFSNFVVLESLVVPGDAATSARNITGSDFLFRLGFFSFFIMVIFDLFLAWAFYILLKPADKNLSLLSAWLRIVNAAIFGVALVHLLNVLQIYNSAEYQYGINTNLLNMQAMLSLASFNYMWLIGLVFFGLHLLVLGYLIHISGYIPKVFGLLLIIAAFGYLIDSFANFLLPNYKDYKDIFLMIVIIPGIIGELSLTFWLLIKGRKLDKVIK